VDEGHNECPSDIANRSRLVSELDNRMSRGFSVRLPRSSEYRFGKGPGGYVADLEKESVSSSFL
jgi:hypothetical protein